MLGTQVLFGFQLQGVFQEEFDKATRLVHILDVLALGFLVVTIGLLLAGPSQHRLVERGNATKRILRAANRFAEVGLATFCAALALDVYVISEAPWGPVTATWAAVIAAVLAIALWYGLGFALRPFAGRKGNAMKSETTELHEKLDQMFTEARVVLPGAQALLGFQFVVTMTRAFGSLPKDVQMIHFLALAAVGIAIMLLIAPVAVHRITFGGEDSQRMHDIGSWLITIALVPLSFGIAGDVYVAVWKVIGDVIASAAALFSISTLLVLWYVVPLSLRRRLIQ
jgi:hypothetical protein